LKETLKNASVSQKTESRKAKHVELVCQERVEHRRKRAGFDELDFEHNALPEIRFDDISLATSLAGHPLKAPLVISSMTGGYEGAYEINRALGLAAERYGVAIGVGSGRQALESAEHHRTFSVVREAAPSSFIFANIGGVEVARLNATGNIGELRRLVDLLEANALAVHLNPLQELLQPEGSRDFRGVLAGIKQCVSTLGVPIIVKEVGAGISQSVARKLLEVGVQIIDVAGAGGTSWAGVEILRNEDKARAALDPFWDWGISTADAVMEVSKLAGEFEFELIASGGIRTGLDVAKSLALGAACAGVARPFIQAVVDGREEALFAVVETFLFQLRAVMFLTGSSDIPSLKQQKLLLR
jgi:isopentenyl-diphosphate delta-isomerase